MLALIVALLLGPTAAELEDPPTRSWTNARLREHCEAGASLLACTRLGSRHLTGRGATKDLVRASEYFGRACPTDGSMIDPHACMKLGTMVYNGNGVKVDHPRAATMFKLACANEIPSACSALGQMYLRGIGGLTKDEDEGEFLLTEACRAGWAGACRVMKSRREAVGLEPRC